MRQVHSELMASLLVKGMQVQKGKAGRLELGIRSSVMGAVWDFLLRVPVFSSVSWLVYFFQ